MTVSTKRDQGREDFWNTVALVALLAEMAGISGGGVIVALFQHLGRQLEVLISFSGLVLTAGLVALIVYVLANPPHDRPPARTSPSYASTPPQVDDYSTLAVIAFVASFLTAIPGIILGHLALREIQRTGKRGRGLAIAALVIGYVLLVFGVLFWILLIALAHG